VAAVVHQSDLGIAGHSIRDSQLEDAYVLMVEGR
jgi:hypothetical protein